MREVILLGFIVHFSVVQGHNPVCALKGSSVALSCPKNDLASTNKWYTVHWNVAKYHVQTELSEDGHHVTYNVRENQLTLTINDVRESDERLYCCRRKAESPAVCWATATKLRVADLQVKVLPATEGEAVMLMCNTSCPLTETPAAYIWYKNRELLYEDESPWYQELVSSEAGVRYSCAIKGYEDLRAPEVSVDSVTSTCFSVTYAKGRMCSKQQNSDKPCSITYPREVQVQWTPSDSYVRLTCSTSCPLTEPQTVYQLYKNRCRQILSWLLVESSSNDAFSCAVRNTEHLHSTEVCIQGKNCWSVNYVNSRICALEGSSVNISAEYTHPDDQEPNLKYWYKTQRSDKEEAEPLPEDVVRVKYHDNKTDHILTINNLTKKDSAKYTFRLRKEQCEGPGVTLTVTALKVTFTPAVVTEGDGVTLTCSTSCPLAGSTNYVWSFNGQPLNLTETQNKHLVLDPVTNQHAGNYSCAVQNHVISSSEETLTVKTQSWASAVAKGGGVVVVVVVVVVVAVLLVTASVVLWFRKRRSSTTTSETSDNTKQLKLTPENDKISPEPAEQTDLHYSQVHFSNSHSCSSVLRREQENVHYAVVNFRHSNSE